MRTPVRATTWGTISFVFVRPGGHFHHLTIPPMASVAACIVASLTLLGACSQDEPEPTQAELLSAIEGRELTPAEVDERGELANLLCSLDDDVLQRIWSKLSPEELAFQDYVFGRVCEERSTLYGQATGRFATESADQ